MSALPPPLLEARGLGVAIGRRRLVENLSLQVEPGQRWVVLGRNGSGKTRLLEVLLGLHAPAAGQVAYAGQVLARLSLREAARLRAFLPQHAPVPFGERVLPAVLTGRHPYRRSPLADDQADDVALARQALAVVDLQALADRRVSELSGGERQRVALAALLAQQAPLLLLDEPLNHLDLRQQQGLLQHLQGLSGQGRAMVCILHDINQALAFATHVVLLDGEGGALAGAAGPLLTAGHLQRIFQVPLCELQAHGQRCFVPAGAV